MHPTHTEYLMPTELALLAATLALMTGHAQCACGQQRGLMAGKIRSNLLNLKQQPRLHDHFRLVIERVHNAWEGLADRSTQMPPSMTLQ